jgi:hypothetical protein
MQEVIWNEEEILVSVATIVHPPLQARKSVAEAKQPSQPASTVDMGES